MSYNNEHKLLKLHIMQQDYFKVLGIKSEDCTNSDVLKKAYRSKLKEVHPDKGGTSEQLREVTTAYNALKQAVQNRQIADNLINIEI